MITQEHTLAEVLIKRILELPTTGPGWDQKVRTECINILWTFFGDVSRGNETLWFAEFCAHLLELHTVQHKGR